MNGGRLLAGSTVFQMFDSLAVDSAGNACVATVFNGGITVASPDGRSISPRPFARSHHHNICFGGPRLATAYVTLSSTGRLVAFAWPAGGLPLNFAG